MLTIDLLNLILVHIRDLHHIKGTGFLAGYFRDAFTGYPFIDGNGTTRIIENRNLCLVNRHRSFYILFIIKGKIIHINGFCERKSDGTHHKIFRELREITVENRFLDVGIEAASGALFHDIGKMGIPEMRMRGYPDTVAAGSIAAGGIASRVDPLRERVAALDRWIAVASGLLLAGFGAAFCWTAATLVS